MLNDLIGIVMCVTWGAAAYALFQRSSRADTRTDSTRTADTAVAHNTTPAVTHAGPEPTPEPEMGKPACEQWWMCPKCPACGLPAGQTRIVLLCEVCTAVVGERRVAHVLELQRTGRETEAYLTAAGLVQQAVAKHRAAQWN